MQSLLTLLAILTPLFVGFFIRLPKPWLRAVDRILAVLVYLILLLIGISLSQVGNLGQQLGGIAVSVLLLFACTMGLNLLVLCAFDHFRPWQRSLAAEEKKQRISIGGSIKQIACVAAGFALGWLLPPAWLPPESTGTYALMLLVFLVGLQLRGSGITLRQILLNKRGVQVALWFTASCLAGGLLFAALMPEVSWSKGLALASGFGWYSLSGIMMTEAYGPVWGSVALINDLSREFFALVFIPMIMPRFPGAAVGSGGATSLDFTLPVIRSSGGLEVVPMAISFGFIANVLPPVLMVVFSAWHF
ncbi:lysine exporter LysO family protein [Neisseria shayeganii]|uniref:Membrane protein n=2 Tax=Neisseria shayeganii TaxID=607712 RepID=G4CGR2_9NEIS|nr:lysine exporter LysO family protein [Neisseria shayeganii]EGY53015.1 membrane protein [Neisseria shayeganii 871]QMT41207.1 lysine exporter LysO family protein [Neisseria shayeganii]